MSDDRADRQQVERRLRETEERFRVAQAASGIGWFEWDLTTDAWDWTLPVACSDLTRPNEADVLGMGTRDLYRRLAQAARSRE